MLVSDQRRQVRLKKQRIFTIQLHTFSKVPNLIIMDKVLTEAKLNNTVKLTYTWLHVYTRLYFDISHASLFALCHLCSVRISQIILQPVHDNSISCLFVTYLFLLSFILSVNFDISSHN
jgi:hypothetical protein